MTETDYYSIDERLQAHYEWVTSFMVLEKKNDEPTRFVLDCSMPDLWRFKEYELSEEVTVFDELNKQAIPWCKEKEGFIGLLRSEEIS